ncbi:MAG: FtsQ-type POTRA domain-containing protein [Alphaproteobacteria bacterium]|nr:FtsQ-type POTRA domain-containing protein [Alphaproteobacteria bacterium]
MFFKAKDKKDDSKKVSLPKDWPYRLIGNLFLLSTIFCLSLVTITIRDELISKKLFDLEQSFYAKTTKLGFTIDDIIIENRQRTSLKEIERKLELNREHNILSSNPRTIKEKLKELPWIKDVTVRRNFFPNVIQVSLKEKNVKAIWQLNNKFHPIDEDGNIIEAEYIPHKPTLLIVGKGAPENFKNLIEVAQKNPEIYDRIKVANYISNRRWNLILDSIDHGITIKLPEEEVEKAWAKLIKIDKSEGILKRKLTIIDLRLPNKVIVKIGKISDKEKETIKNSKESKT